MAFGGLIGKETQVDLSQYVTETELNSKGFATQSWVSGQGYATQSWVNSQGFAKTSQIPSVPSGFGSVVNIGTVNSTYKTIRPNSSGIYLFYSEEIPGTPIVFDMGNIYGSSFNELQGPYVMWTSGQSDIAQIMIRCENYKYQIASHNKNINRCYLYRIR